MYATEDRFTGEWTHAERSEYAALKGGRGAPAGAAIVPPIVRETLLALRDESPEDEDLAWALAVVGTAAEGDGN